MNRETEIETEIEMNRETEIEMNRETDRSMKTARGKTDVCP